MASGPSRSRLVALLFGVAACNEVSGVSDLVFDDDAAGSTSTAASTSTSVVSSSGVGGGGGSSTSATTGSGAQAGASTGVTSSSAAAGGAGGGGMGGSPGACGDGTLDPGEQCDDGDVASGDGCSPTCTVDGVDSCPVAAVTLTKEDLVVMGSTVGVSPDYESACWGFQSPDLFYAITPAQGGTINASISANFAVILSVHESCGDESTEIVCDKTPRVAVSIPAFAGTTYYFVVDGDSGSSGGFTLTFKLL